jgi:hypothetical protein
LKNVNELHLLQLPDSILSRASTFLDLKGKVMFAMALPYWKEDETHAVSRAIVGAERIRRLDFGDLGDDVTYNLTDKDVYRILNCVDAVNNVERLFFTHCYSIKGHGLEPLRGSTKLQQIDLSLLSRYEAPMEK